MLSLKAHSFINSLNLVSIAPGVVGKGEYLSAAHLLAAPVKEAKVYRAANGLCYGVISGFPFPGGLSGTLRGYGKDELILFFFFLSFFLGKKKKKDSINQKI